jgi:hypothetical protein
MKVRDSGPSRPSHAETRIRKEHHVNDYAVATVSLAVDGLTVEMKSRSYRCCVCGAWLKH